MQINYLGHSCFKIKSKNTTVIIDPFNDYLGFSMPKTRAEIVIISHPHKDHNCLKKIEGKPFVINAPGEYEIADISIFGLATFHDKVKGEKRGKNIVYSIRAEGISLCHLGDLGHKLNEKQLEEVNGVDILFIPVGGTYTLGSKEAVDVIAQVEPKIVIPMHYKVAGLSADFAKNLESLKDFLEEVGSPEVTPQEKLVISKTSLPEEREIVPMLRK